MGDALGTDKDVEKLARRARQAGWTVEIDGGTHIRWRAPGGSTMFSSPLTGGRAVRLRVERHLASADPARFADLAPAVAARAAGDDLASPAVRARFHDESAAAAAELRAAAELVEELASSLDPQGAADAVQQARAVLRTLEGELRRIVRRESGSAAQVGAEPA